MIERGGTKMDKEVIKRAEAVICKMLDQLGTAEIGKPDYERKINATCTAIHAAVEVINIQEKGR